MPIPSLFDVCTPREDVLTGSLTEADFAADLAQVLNGKAPQEYQNPAAFFANTHPTRGLKNLLTLVCQRLLGNTGQVASIFRLDTNYGGGKTHALIALAHVARGLPHVANMMEFIDPALVPQTPVRIAAFDGENADPVNGHTMGEGIRAYTPWGELAYALAGTTGYNLIKNSDEKGIAPGADTIKELFAGQPVLILMDELSVYLRKQSGTQELTRAAEQLTAFLTALFKAVESSPCAALVYTLAIGKNSHQAIDAYSPENQVIAQMMGEAESVSARKATLLDPTEEDETVKVLQRRLFARIDFAGAQQIVDAYARLWDEHKDHLPCFGLKDTRQDDFYAGFPLHPELIAVLKEKTSTLDNFQRVRGMLRLLARTVARLWSVRPAFTHAVHLHHIDLSYGPIRQEIITRLGQKCFVPALTADIAAIPGDAPSLAEQIDSEQYHGLPPYASCVARAIFLHTLAFNENLKGATENELRYSLLAPELETGFINDAIRRFKLESAYLDDKPNRPLRFMVAANLTQMIQRREKQIEPKEIRARLTDAIRATFTGSVFALVPYPALPNDVDDVADKPILVVMGYEATAVSTSSAAISVPDLVCRIFQYKTADGLPRLNRNNLVFVVADEAKVEEMKNFMRRRLALEDMHNTPSLREDLEAWQKDQLAERYRKSEQELALGIQQAYRHVFYPSRDRLEGASVDLAHITVEVQNASANPGAGQKQVVRVLHSTGKLRLPEDNPDSPLFLSNRTELKKGQITTARLRSEYHRDPAFPILTDDCLLVSAIRMGIEQSQFVYQCGALVCGKGDPFPHIAISEQAVVLTLTRARDTKVWPRELATPPPSPEPEPGPGPIRPRPLDDGQGNAVPPSTPPAVAQVTAEGVLKEALTQIWEKAGEAGFTAIGELVMRFFDANDGFILMGLVNTLDCEKVAAFKVEYEIADGSTCQMGFEGSCAEGAKIKAFLMPQLRAAREYNLEDLTITLRFASGLALAGNASQKLRQALTVAGGATAYVTATATKG